MGRRDNKADNIYTAGQVLMINKPLGWTSFGVVKKIRWLTGAKTGHAGTLDPLATGLLICCTGKYTKKISEYQQQEKEYTATLTLGAETPTYDLESEPRNERDYDHITADLVQSVAGKFTGEQWQLPPAHAAIKKDGKPIYQLARQGIAVELEPRKIFIRSLEITRVALPSVDIRVVCGTGTYIRSLAHDLGKALGCGAYLSALCRTRIGDFRLEDALDMEAAATMIRTALLKTDSPPPD